MVRRFRMAPSMMSAISLTVVSPGNSSGMSVRVAPADLPIPSARKPALRPIVTHRYQRSVVRESSIRLATRVEPKWRAVA